MNPFIYIIVQYVEFKCIIMCIYICIRVVLKDCFFCLVLMYVEIHFDWIFLGLKT